MDEYVRGEVSTQAIENFWSCLKWTLNGTCIAVEPFHIERYLDEQMSAFNNRHWNDRWNAFPEGSGASWRQAAYMGGVDWEGVSQSRLRLALFGGVGVFRMRRRLLALGLSDLIPDFLWIGGEDGSQSLRELCMLW